MKWIPKVDCGLFEAYDKGYVHVVKTVAYVHVVNSVTYFQANENFEQKKTFPFKTLNLKNHLKKGEILQTLSMVMTQPPGRLTCRSAWWLILTGITRGSMERGGAKRLRLVIKL